MRTSTGCFRLDRDNYRLAAAAARATFTVDSVSACGFRCNELLGRAGCRSFAFRNYRSVGNCAVATLDVADVVVDRDLVADGTWEYYESLDRGGAECGGLGPNTNVDYGERVWFHPRSQIVDL